MPRFHIRDAFQIPDKRLFVMAGFVVEGEIADGMLVRLPLLANAMVTAEIEQIQYVRRPDGDVVCLCIRCRDAKESTFWEALKLKDRTVEIVAAASLV